MEFLGIGPLELVLIFVITLIVLGPQQMVSTGRTLGKFVRDMRDSPAWREFQKTSRQIMQLPDELVRQTDLKDLGKELTAQMNPPQPAKPANARPGEPDISAWTKRPDPENGQTTNPSPPASSEKP